MAEKRRRLSRDDWIAAALTALAEGGVGAVAIEPLAARLGATKGSAYWHFANRDELLRAALQRWEHDETDAVIALVSTEPDPAVGLRTLLGAALSHPQENLTILLAGAMDPLVEPVLTRVTNRRIDYLTELFVRLGFDGEAARHHAVLAYSAYLGTGQLWRTARGALPANADAWDSYLDEIWRVLTEAGS
ncbi:TetR/AcrR family transcriptional regulator [Nocardia bovistercoris]|uniref:TetR/AcrR family transcriptional regulator n=1 Tax=Nocardia bovistercoris TaxID=2785916 RepID=A0A931N0H9_9NOCA|nr:TetR/AcrR family transcriptional regulator [Nocardia bovistercoris]MBH0774697.1 TetR/AcrR family transcriptional regulator [Nocardia bovistercoris]